MYLDCKEVAIDYYTQYTVPFISGVCVVYAYVIVLPRYKISSWDRSNSRSSCLVEIPQLGVKQ